MTRLCIICFLILQKMSINSVLIIFICLGYSGIYSQQTFRQYVIKKDFFTGLKSGEFSIYDQSGNNLIYRIESRYGFMQSAEVYSYPGKRLVASIKNNWYLWSKISFFFRIYF